MRYRRFKKKFKRYRKKGGYRRKTVRRLLRRMRKRQFKRRVLTQHERKFNYVTTVKRFQQVRPNPAQIRNSETWGIMSLCFPSEGTAKNQRVGQYIYIKSVVVKWFYKNQYDMGTSPASDVMQGPIAFMECKEKFCDTNVSTDKIWENTSYPRPWTLGVNFANIDPYYYTLKMKGKAFMTGNPLNTLATNTGWLVPGSYPQVSITETRKGNYWMGQKKYKINKRVCELPSGNPNIVNIPDILFIPIYYGNWVNVLSQSATLLPEVNLEYRMTFYDDC